MKVMIAASSGWIGFCLADHVFYGGRLVQSLQGFARAIAAGFGFYF
jgi:hypothetical protein